MNRQSRDALDKASKLLEVAERSPVDWAVAKTYVALGYIELAKALNGGGLGGIQPPPPPPSAGLTVRPRG